MAEIKLNDSFAAEVDAFRASAGKLDTGNVYSASTGELSLPAADAYQERLFRIRRLIIQFGILVKKDADDMDALAGRLRSADATAIGGSGGSI